MGQITIHAEQVLDARPADVYAVIADYKTGHPQILPSKSMYDLQVEQGGYGAGTVIRFKMKILGVEQSAYQIASEPEPGRVLQEQDIAEPGAAKTPRNIKTTFTVDPRDGGARSQVTIHTTMNASAGVAGWIEGVLAPRVLAPVYRQELRQLEAVAQRRVAASQA